MCKNLQEFLSHKPCSQLFFEGFADLTSFFKTKENSVLLRPSLYLDYHRCKMSEN